MCLFIYFLKTPLTFLLISCEKISHDISLPEVLILFALIFKLRNAEVRVENDLYIYDFAHCSSCDHDDDLAWKNSTDSFLRKMSLKKSKETKNIYILNVIYCLLIFTSYH